MTGELRGFLKFRVAPADTTSVWRVISADFEQVSTLRRDVRAHLAPLAEPEADLGAAELVVSELLTNAVEHGEGPISFDLDWTGSHPIVTISDLGDGFDDLPDQLPAPDEVTGRGLMIVEAVTLDLRVLRTSNGSVVQATLDLDRRDPVRSADETGECNADEPAGHPHLTLAPSPTAADIVRHGGAASIDRHAAVTA